MKKLDYDYHAAPILEWMSHKWALVTLLKFLKLYDRKTITKKNFRHHLFKYR